VIQYWSRAHQRLETEQVYGEAGVSWLYENPLGQLAAGPLASAWVSKLYGAYQSSRASAGKIPSFVQKFQIPMGDYVEPSGRFRSFNDFFIRAFRPGLRPIEPAGERMAAFAEARYYGWESVSDEQVFPVKGQHLSARALLGGVGRVEDFAGGPLLLARLCPVDYHRFHFPDDGRQIEFGRVAGRYHSVNPVALRRHPEIFETNERQVSILETRHFGKLAYIELGAMMVGRIVQTHSGASFTRGQEKGYFLFGGSTVIVLGQPGAWSPDSDILKHTAEQREVLVRLGEGIARLTSKS
jgi:phosphatidylserine decarboxylase